MTFYDRLAFPGDDCIRVFTIHGDHYHAEIELSVEIVQLSARPEPNFSALSYTWSEPLEETDPAYRAYDCSQCIILCDGHRLPIQQNLHEALQQLRRMGDHSAWWIDAISINQHDDDERNTQLALMPRIYHEAGMVFVWLGQEDETISEVIRVQDLLANDSAILADLMDPWALDSRHHTQHISLHAMLEGTEASLMRFFKRRWFGRVWTLQEILMPRIVRAFCGSTEVDIGAIVWYAGPLLKAYASVNTVLFEKSTMQGLGGAACISAWLTLTWRGGGFGSRAFMRYPRIDKELRIPRTYKWLVALELLVHESRQRLCSKLEDKIIAPLAFALYRDFVPGTEEAFQPIAHYARSLLDIRTSTAELYQSFTVFLLKSMGNLDVLSRCQMEMPSLHSDPDAERIHHLPSWVPRYNTAGSASLIDSLLLYRFDAARYLGSYKFNESDAATSELAVHAIMLGRIAEVSQYTAPADTVASWLSYVQKDAAIPPFEQFTQRSDLAQTLFDQVGTRLEDCVTAERKAKANFGELLRNNLSITTLIQVNTVVSIKTYTWLMPLVSADFTQFIG